MNMPTSPFGVTPSTNPATGESLGGVANTNMETFPSIVEGARNAQQQWGQLPYKQRRQHIEKMRRYLVDNADKVAGIVSQENGKTRQDALVTEVLPCTLACAWYGKHSARILKSENRGAGSIVFMQKRSKIIHVPLGVVGIISPWNYPLSIPFGEVIMGLMAGNAVILKVAAATPLIGQLIEDIVAAGELPEGLFTHVVGSGGAVSTAMFENRLDKVFFTGSVPTGKQLMAQAAATLTPLSLELGGKDAMVVLEDADLDRATNGAIWGGFQNAGQTCAGIERVYVHASIYDDFMALMKTKTAALRHGPGNGIGQVDIGAMTTSKQLQTVEHQLEDALAKGAVIEAQSQATGDLSNGNFHPATLISNVNRDMEVMVEETFGPILPVEKFNTIDEAIAKANDCTMALTASVWGGKNAEQVATRLVAGVVAINDHLMTHGMSEMPWGGPKESGLGRTHGPEGLLEMTRPLGISWDIFKGKRNLWWYPQDENSYKALLAAIHLGSPRNPIVFLKAACAVLPAMIKSMFATWKP